LVVRLWPSYGPRMGTGARHLGGTTTLLEYDGNRNESAGAKHAAMDAGLESATEILLEMLGLGSSWGNHGILPMRSLRRQKEATRCPSLMEYFAAYVIRRTNPHAPREQQVLVMCEWEAW
jgi:hypothetical protein